jgi:hypothetical protein
MAAQLDTLPGGGTEIVQVVCSEDETDSSSVVRLANALVGLSVDCVVYRMVVEMVYESAV